MTESEDYTHFLQSMLNEYKSAVVELDFLFLSKIITKQAIEVGDIDDSQFIVVNDIEVDNENGVLLANVELLRYIRN